MSNAELCKHYLSLQNTTGTPVGGMSDVVYTEILTALENRFEEHWTWELADEKFYADGSSVCTTVTVYIPGLILTGRSVCKIKDYHDNHLRAIYDACKRFIVKPKQQEQPQAQQPQNNNMTPEQIMAAINNGQQQPPAPQVNTKEDFYNYTDESGMPADVPFDAVTDNCQQQLNQEMGFMNAPQEPQTAQQQPQQNQQANSQPNPQQPAQSQQDGQFGYDDPQPRLKGYSQRQIDGINKFKHDFEVLNDDMFGNYVKTWDKTLHSKQDINPSNVNGFLRWIEELGK